ncbi:type II 3-dehydroquinate dehydratase [Reinekea sp. G2M2-21]|uniref:type II 3-dehydroquinate dehydratase n=1 Tax=Reinekea sp. G2M2-21 TaxID=2788942 RepID=UPI0018A9E0F4|nr:type II 3-dehydroquinate dehydratase [Reinekea sp. G2M2-21]
MATLLLLNGPNLNLLGTREPEIYGTQTLADIEESASQVAASLGHRLVSLQSNHEGVLIDRIHETLSDGTDMILINPGAYTHTSVAIRDALAGVNKPFVEIHLSNVHAREDFRKHSYLAPIAVGVIAGFGTHSYTLAIEAADNYLKI